MNRALKYLYAICVILVLGGGLWFSLQLNDLPQSVAKINYTRFERVEEFPLLLQSKLDAEIKRSPLLFLGVTPGRRQDLEFWKTFLEAQKDPQFSYQAVVIDPKLPSGNEVFPGALQIDIKNEMARFSEGAKNAANQKIRMVVIVPTIYSAQVIEENPVNMLKKTYQLDPLSLSLVLFPRSLAEEADVEHPCKIGDQNRDGTGALGCVIQNRARPLYKVNPVPGSYEGIADQMGQRDYLIYWNLLAR